MTEQILYFVTQALPLVALAVLSFQCGHDAGIEHARKIITKKEAELRDSSGS